MRSVMLVFLPLLACDVAVARSLDAKGRDSENLRRRVQTDGACFEVMGAVEGEVEQEFFGLGQYLQVDQVYGLGVKRVEQFLSLGAGKIPGFQEAEESVEASEQAFSTFAGESLPDVREFAGPVLGAGSESISQLNKASLSRLERIPVLNHGDVAKIEVQMQDSIECLESSYCTKRNTATIQSIFQTTQSMASTGQVLVKAMSECVGEAEHSPSTFDANCFQDGVKDWLTRQPLDLESVEQEAGNWEEIMQNPLPSGAPLFTIHNDERVKTFLQCFNTANGSN